MQGGFIPGMNLTWGGGDIPLSGFENLITLSVSLRYLEAEFKHFKMLKTHQGFFS
jgi:hypothetical protein